jgi:hypothetical protein
MCFLSVFSCWVYFTVKNSPSNTYNTYTYYTLWAWIYLCCLKFNYIYWRVQTVRHPGEVLSRFNRFFPHDHHSDAYAYEHLKLHDLSRGYIILMHSFLLKFIVALNSVLPFWKLLRRPHINCVKTSIKTWDKRNESWRHHHDSDRCAAVFIISFVSTVLLSLRHVADIMSWRMPVCGLPSNSCSVYTTLFYVQCMLFE